MEIFSDIGYLKHCFGVYVMCLVFVFAFIFLNAQGGLKEVLFGSIVLLGMYSFIFILIFIAVPFLPTGV